MPSIPLTYFTIRYHCTSFTMVHTTIICLLNCGNNPQSGLPASIFLVYLRTAKVILLNYKSGYNSFLLKILPCFQIIENNIKKSLSWLTVPSWFMVPQPFLQPFFLLFPLFDVLERHRSSCWFLSTSTSRPLKLLLTLSRMASIAGNLQACSLISFKSPVKVLLLR